MSFIFGGDTGETPETLARKRAMAAAIMNQEQPRDFWSGLNFAGSKIAGALLDRSASRKEDAGRGSAADQYQRVVAEALGGGRAPAPAAPAPSAPGGFDPSRIAAAIQSAGPSLADAVQHVESGGDPNAVSPKGATGLMQIMPATARDPGFGVPNIFDTARATGMQVPDDSEETLQALLRDPGVNRRFGEAYLGAMGGQFGEGTPEQLAAYNAGPGAVQRAGGVPNYRETQDYVQRVQARMGGQPQAPQAMPQQPAPQQPGGISPALMEALANPFMNDGQRAVLSALMQRELGGGGDPTSGMREYELARSQGFQGSFLDYRTALAEAGRSNTSVNVNTAEGPRPQLLGNTGFVAIPDETQPSGYRFEAAPGGPADLAAREAEETARTRQENVETAGGTVIQDIGRALELLGEHRRFTAGRGATIGGMIPGSPATVLQQMVDSIKSNVGVDQLQRMREGSPTGGALGNVTERQLEGLQSLLGSLDITQPPDVLEDNLKRIANLYNDLIHGRGEGPERFELSFDEQGRPKRPRVQTYNPATDSFE